MPRITPNLWFDSNGLEAAAFYVSIFPNSEIQRVTYYGEGDRRDAGDVLTVAFSLDGHDYVAINGGPMFTFSEAVSLAINCADQTEIDYYWERLTDGGSESMCGWLKDRYGFSWQVGFHGLVDLLNDTPERSTRARAALYTMRKLDIAALKAAADG